MRISAIHQGERYLIKVWLPGRPRSFARRSVTVTAKLAGAVEVAQTHWVCVNLDEHREHLAYAILNRLLRYEPEIRHDTIPVKDVIGPDLDPPRAVRVEQASPAPAAEVEASNVIDLTARRAAAAV